MTLLPSLKQILMPAYPCPGFKGACRNEMRWKPEAGHVPRGFCGASGEPSEVELVLVVAEPGDPHDGEQHSGIDSAYKYATKVLREGKDVFHKNLQIILDACWPDLSFEEQMRKVWLTESVLCSARAECGPVSRAASDECGRRYLRAQVDLFESALVVALGNKARDRPRNLDVKNVLAVRAVAPPGGLSPKAREPWKQIPVELARRRAT